MSVRTEPFAAEAGPGGLRLSARSNLTAAHVAEQREYLKRAVQGTPGNVILDLSACSMVDSLGVTLVVGLFKTCQARELGFSVEGVNEEILRLFKFLNLDEIFEVIQSSERRP